MQIGKPGQSKGSNDTANLGAPANMVVDSAANELYVADGYVNHRVIVFDATTGAYKRHWGAYGKTPDDGWFTRAGETLPGPFRGVVQNENRPSQYDPNGPPAPQFRIVHAVRISKDGLVYVCDRTNDRLQVFTKGRRLRARGRHQQGHARQRLGVGRRLLDGSSADVPLHQRRDEPADLRRSIDRRCRSSAPSAAPDTGRDSSTARTCWR